jgi:hypothetical protein
LRKTGFKKKPIVAPGTCPSTGCDTGRRIDPRIQAEEIES